MKSIFFKKTNNIRFFLEFIKNKFIKFLCNLLVINILIYHTFWITTNSCYIIANADKFLALWLNSSIFDFYKHLNFVAYGNPENKGLCKLDYNKMIDVPIPIYFR
jgi:hypothetical protein